MHTLIVIKALECFVPFLRHEFECVLIGLNICTRCRENKGRDKLEANGNVPEFDYVEFMDLTHKQNLKFRYVV